MSTTTVVNGRFLTMQTTGVQRYAGELLRYLPAHTEGQVVVAVPPGHLIDGRDHDRLADIAMTPRWHGPRGHAWEQARLPALVRRAGANAVLLSPAHWGPVRVRRHVALFQDIGPQLYPEYFTRGYRAWSGVLTPLMVRRCARLAVSCPAVSADLCRRYHADAARIDLVPPGVGAPFDRWPIDDLARRSSDYCLMVGGHDRRKNVRWVLDWWPSVHAELGLHLVVTTRGGSTVRFSDEIGAVAGVTWRIDPSDEELAGLYAGALCLLWPSVYEGFGLPLLEAMAVGTPFLSTDTGAARDLALEQGQVLPLDQSRWIDQLRGWANVGLGSLRADSVACARALTWDATGQAAAASLAKVAG
jgi:glycosyltransferase involved in cell wall biosynthesis